MEAENSGILVIKNLPHGFYEQQLLGFFSQFGTVEFVKVKRSRTSGRSCGVGYLKFEVPEVASIAGKSMDNYMMYGVTLKCQVMPVAWKQARPNLFHASNSASSIEKIGRSGFVEERDKRLQRRKEKAAASEEFASWEAYLKRCHKMIGKDILLARKIREAGIDYTYPPLQMNEAMQAAWEEFQESKKKNPAAKTEREWEATSDSDGTSASESA